MSTIPNIATGASLTAAACVATSNVTPLSGNAAIDGYTPAATDIVLLTKQTTGSQNGQWLIPSGGGAWTRPAGFSSGSVVKGKSCRILNGTSYAGSDWTLVAPTAGVTIDTTSQTWVNSFEPVLIDGGAWQSGTVSANNITYATGVWVTDAGVRWADTVGGASTTRPSSDTTGRWMSLIPTKVKRATQTIGSPNATFGSTLSGTTQYQQRVIISLPVGTLRWRIKVSTANAQTGSVPSSPSSASITGVYVGTPAYASSGRWIGNATAGLTTALSTTLSVASTGTDAVSGWVTASAAQFAAHTPTVFSVALSAAAGNIIQGDNQAYVVAGAADIPTNNTQSASASPSGIAVGSWVLDFRIEYEVEAKPENLACLVIGASAESGYTPTGDLSTTAVAGTEPNETWPAVMGLKRNHLPINAGLGGTVTSNWTTATGRPYTRFDLATTVPDYAIIGMLASNDVAALSNSATTQQITAALTTIQANMQSIVTNIKALGISRYFFATMPPRNFSSGGSQETLRGQVNAWIQSIPLGAEGILPFDYALRATSTSLTIAADLVSSDNIHPLRPGYALLGSLVVVGQ